MFGNIPPQLYNPIYLVFMIIITIVHFIRMYPLSTDEIIYKKKDNWLAPVISLLLILFIGLRPISGRYFGDMGSYAWMFNQYADGIADPAQKGDWLFMFFVKSFASFTTAKYFFLFIEFLYIFPILLACIRISKENNYTLLLFAFGAMSFFSYGTNGIRNGAASSCFLLAITFLRGKPWHKIVFLLLSLMSFLLHSSMALPFMAVLAAYFIKNPKLMFYFWGASFVVSLFAGEAVSSFFSAIGFEERLSSYLSGPGHVEDHIARTGFRWDFLLYSAMPIVLGWWVIFRKKIYTATYAILLGTYIYANSFWIMVIRAPYSNRFAYLSWFLYPIVLAYPMLVMPVWKKAPGLKLGIIMLGHLAFTVLMSIIYSSR